MSQNKDEAGGETHEHKEARKEANSEAKKEDTGSTGVGRHRGGHENSQRPGKTKDDHDGQTSNA